MQRDAKGGYMIKTKQEKRIVYLAYFCRFGFFALMLLLGLGLRISIFKEYTKYFLPGIGILYGTYLLLGLRFRFKHIYCAMQEAYKQKMTPNSSCNFTKEMVRDLLVIGSGFVLGGVVGIIVVYLYT